MNTKTIANKAGKTTAQVNEMMRDLNLAHQYDEANRCWRLTDHREAVQFVNYLMGA